MTVFRAVLRSSALAGAFLCLAGLSPALADSWRGWNIHPPGYPNTIALEEFAAEIGEKTGGRLAATVYNNATLGDQPDAIEQTRNGALDFGNFNMGPMGPIVPATNVLSLPFLFSSVEQMHRVMDGEIGERFAAALAERGLIALSWYDSGSRSFYNTRRPIETPEDVQGMKIRVMNNDLYVDMIAALGGNATPMAYGEVFQSLRTGVIDGAENNYPSFESSNHYEVVRYYSASDHLVIPECLCIARRSWERLSAEDQEIVRAAALASAERQRALWAEREQVSRDKVVAAGVAINEIADKSAFQAAMAPVYDKFIAANPDLEPLIRDIQSTP